MAFDATNPVSVGSATKKAHFDQLLANDVLLKTSISNDGLTWGSTVLATGTVGYHLGASGTSYGFVGTNTNHDFYLRRNASNIWQITEQQVMKYVGTPTNYQFAALSLLNDLHWIQLGSNGLSVLQGVGSALSLQYNMQNDGAGNWRNITNATVGMIRVGGASIEFYADASPGTAYTAFSPTQQFNINTTQITCYRDVLASAHNTYDLGSTGTRWADGWFQGVVTAAGGFVGNVTGTATSATSASSAGTCDNGKTSGGFSGSSAYTNFTFDNGFCTAAS